MKHYNAEGMRLTDCCGAYSTYYNEVDGTATLYCKRCFCDVEQGQGDGTEYKPRRTFAIGTHRNGNTTALLIN